MDKFLSKRKLSTESETASTSAASKAAKFTDEEEENSCDSDHEHQGNVQTSKTRKFRSNWVYDFPWLKEKDANAYCVACGKALINHLTHLKKHDKARAHVENLAIKRNQTKLEMFMSKESLSLQKQVEFAELTLTMFIISHNLPFLLMDFLPNLLVECCPDSKIAKLVKCGRTKSTDIAKVLGKKAADQIISSLKTRKFSLIVDETTDISAKKALVLVVRYVCSTSFIVRDRFLGLLEITKADASSIFSAITDFFLNHEIPLSNLIGLATDGASVMAGDLNGLKQKFKNEIDLFYLKCSCHSLHLCSSYACKMLPKELEKLCRDIYNFFSHSSKRIYEFKEFQEYCNVKPHKILGVSMTRWLALENVINRIIEQWDSLKLYFISNYLEVNGVRACDMAHIMNSKSKVYFLFLSYNLNIINNLNKEFQSEKVRLPYLFSHLETNCKLILSNFMNNNFLKNIDCLSKVDLSSRSNCLPLKDIFMGNKAEIYFRSCNFSEIEEKEIKSNILSFYIELFNQIKIRFNFESDELKCLSIITPQRVLSDCEVSIEPLLTYFQNLVDCDFEIIMTQWKLLRFSKTNLTADIDINIFWEKVSCIKNGMGDMCFKELCAFVFNLMSLPHSSAAAERKFSDLALIKTKLRNRLEFSTINDIMLAKELLNKEEANYVWSARNVFK